jgi:poly(glycerol-phosphate) alpha-glucosyltransferase
MKIGFVSDSLSSTAGGIFEIERSLALHLRDLGVGVTAWGVNDHRWADDRAQWQNIDCRVRNRLGPRIFGYVPGLIPDLVNSDCDLLHLQHLWMYPSVAVHQWHRRTGKPFLVTANGMLEPWTLSRSRLNKIMAALLYENRMLHRATCVQANTEKEVADFRAYGLKNPVCLIPNGVDLPGETGQGPWVTGHGGERIKTLLFLGRLHPKKGLVNALRAWSEVTGHGSQEEWQFVIAGWDQGGHGEDLKKLCTELGLSYSNCPPPIDFAPLWTLRLPVPGTHLDSLDCPSPLLPVAPIANRPPPTVLFTGPVFGEAKEALLRRADAFVLPSFSEGLPMAVLEAWAYRLPVLMTDHCNLPEGFAAGAAIRIGTDTASIAEGMRNLTALSDSERLAMGEAGRALVEERFTWDKVAAQMKEVYAWMLGEGEKPGGVD